MTIRPDVWDGVDVVRLANERLEAVVAPSIGGRIVSLVDRATGYEFLWRNAGLSLRREAPGAEYDPSFYGGVDELLPNDVPEPIGGDAGLDHGELWTFALASEIEGDTLRLDGVLPRCGLRYERRMRLDGNRILFDYRLENAGRSSLAFLWKLHAALKIAPGDRVVCPAATVRAGDPEWSRLKREGPVSWPPEGGDALIVPSFDGTTEFLHLSELREGFLGWESADGRRRLSYRFDPRVFPYPWYFASYGGFDGHLVGILEPCTTMPISVAEAAALDQTAALEPGEALVTSVALEAEVSI